MILVAQAAAFTAATTALPLLDSAMSRTYRLRNTGTRFAVKWVDAPVTLYRAIVNERQSYILTHGIYNIPCVVMDRPVLERHREDWGMEDVHTVDHMRCWYAHFGEDRSPLGYKRYPPRLEPLAEKMAVLPATYHPWARVHRRGRSKEWRRVEQKSGRVLVRNRMVRMERRNELDCF